MRAMLLIASAYWPYPQAQEISPPADMSYTSHPLEERGSPDVVLSYISQILMDESMESATFMFSENTLEAAERSFQDVLGGRHPSLINQTPSLQNVDSPANNCTSFCNYHDCKSIPNATNAIESSLVSDLSKQKSCCIQAPRSDQYTSLSNARSSMPSFSHPNGSGNTVDSLADPPIYTPLVPGSVGESQTFLQRMGVRKETRGLLRHRNHGNLNLKSNRLIPLAPKEKHLVMVTAVEQCKTDQSSTELVERKNFTNIVNLSVEPKRRNKHLAIYDEVPEPSEGFNEGLLFNREDDASPTCKMFPRSGQHDGASGKATRRKKRVNNGDVVDIRTLLMHCAEAVGGNDLKCANELLWQTRQYSSPFGDGSQRLAHCFANALQARLAGTESKFYEALVAKKVSSIHIFKAFRLFISACPFMRVTNFFVTQTVMEVAKKATRLHIIHFGILYGSLWPELIQSLSGRPGGPPSLRITGIDLPQPGLEPAARIDETRRRLASYCERFNVSVEYNGIVQKWETIQFKDLKIFKGEMVIVNCLYLFRYLYDDTVVSSSPRDSVLQLIKMINPDVFIHGIINGSYNSPFFTSRFREALYYYSAVFDMFEANVPREDEDRMVFEQEIYGKEVLNVIACEGVKRFDRPETYRQWQVRNRRAGLRQLPLNQEILKKVKEQVKLCYNKDFLADEANQWLLQGWKGRILFALSCWKTA